jgi:hypothetical protein
MTCTVSTQIIWHDLGWLAGWLAACCRCCPQSGGQPHSFYRLTTVNAWAPDTRILLLQEGGQTHANVWVNACKSGQINGWTQCKSGLTSGGGNTGLTSGGGHTGLTSGGGHTGQING